MARKTKSTMLDLTAAVQEICEEYGDEVKEETAKIVRRISPEIQEKLKSASPRSTYSHEHYADSWVYEVNTNSFGTDKVTVYSKDKWRLTHLLENSHEMIVHGKHIGRSKPQKHIKPVQEWAEAEIMKELESKL